MAIVYTCYQYILNLECMALTIAARIDSILLSVDNCIQLDLSLPIVDAYDYIPLPFRAVYLPKLLDSTNARFDSIATELEYLLKFAPSNESCI